MKVEIDKMRDVIIVEKRVGDSIAANSQLFCGCCGETLGTVINEIEFPFNSLDLIENMKDRTFKSTLFGLLHETCGHRMFVWRSWDFISLPDYIKHQKENV